MLLLCPSFHSCVSCSMWEQRVGGALSPFLSLEFQARGKLRSAGLKMYGLGPKEPEMQRMRLAQCARGAPPGDRHAPRSVGDATRSLSGKGLSPVCRSGRWTRLMYHSFPPSSDPSKAPVIRVGGHQGDGGIQHWASF